MRNINGFSQIFILNFMRRYLASIFSTLFSREKESFQLLGKPSWVLALVFFLIPLPLAYWNLLAALLFSAIFAIGGAMFSAWQGKQAFILSQGGLVFTSPYLEILFPWRSILSGESAVLLPDGCLALHLSGCTAGLDYVVRKATHYTEDEHSFLPLSFEGKTVLFDAFNGISYPRLRLAISTAKKEWDLKVSKHMQAETLPCHCIDFERSDLEQGVLCIIKGAPINFPSFCPITGEDCDEMMEVPLGQESVSWFLSGSCVRKKRQQRHLKLGAMIFCLLLCSAWALRVDWQDLSFLQYLEEFLPIAIPFLVLSPLFFFLDCPFELEIHPGKRSDIFLAHIQSEDYLQAFVQVNGGLGRDLG